MRLITSRWQMNGATYQCAHPHCRVPFDGAAYRGKGGAYYCSRNCRADMSDEETIEDKARQVH